MPEETIIKLPEVTPDNIDALMKERIPATKTDVTTIPALWQGFLEMPLHMGDTTRKTILYIPKDTRQGTAITLLNIPDGEETINFLIKSGWTDLADKMEFCICAVQPGKDGWMDPDDEIPYFIKCVRMLIVGIYFRGGMGVYVTGYGKIGTALHKAVMNTPLQITAAAFVDASDIDSAYLEKTGKKSLDDEAHTYGFTLDDIPVPVWILETKNNERAETVTAYWAAIIGADKAVSDPVYGKIFHQKKDYTGTPEGHIVNVCKKELDPETDVSDPALTQMLCHFLTRYARYGKASPIGNSLVFYADYETLGIDIRYFTDPQGVSRECLVYVPKAFAKKGKLPLVFALHGACESIRNYIEESQWFRKADEEGFIVVMPEATLQPVPAAISGGYLKVHRTLWKLFDPKTREEDIEYFDQLLDRLIAEYPVDETRIYGTGHSMGCMMINYICSSKLGGRFAAIATSSGILDTWNDEGCDTVPYWLNMGEYDLWSHDISSEEELSSTLDHWLIRNNLATKENVREVRLSGMAKTYKEGRFNGMVWKNADNIPLLNYEWIDTKDHMNAPQDNYRFWDKWFSKWTLDPRKGRCYKGRPI